MSTPPPTGAPGITEAQQVVNAIEEITDYTADNCHRELQEYSPYAVAVAAAYLAETAAGGAGGPMALTDLSDVTGASGPNLSPVYDGNTGIAPLTEVTTRQDLDEILAAVAAVEWHAVGDAGEPAFLSGFGNIGDPWAPARYRLTLNNVVYLEGSLRNPDTTIADATWIPIFQLPEDCRPSAALEFDALTNEDAMSKIVVWTDGNVVWVGYKLGPHGTIQRIALNGISFSIG